MFLSRWSSAALRVPLASWACASSALSRVPSASYTTPPTQSSEARGVLDGEKKTHFGYDTVTEKEKAEKVLGVFHNVADKYDLMNDAMSLGIHRLWKDYFVNNVFAPEPGINMLDVAGGTGDIAFRIIEAMQKNRSKSSHEANRGHVVCCDINTSMLNVGERRAQQMGLDPELISWKEGDAMNLPFEDNTFDAYTIAFGIRNVVRVEDALSEAYRVLRPGGRFLCLEFSRVDNPVLSSIYDLYSFQVIPPMGQVLASDWDSYQYLVESIRKFPDQEAFKKMIRDVGFKGVHYENLTFGVAAIHSGFKLI